MSNSCILGLEGFTLDDLTQSKVQTSKCGLLCKYGICDCQKIYEYLKIISNNFICQFSFVQNIIILTESQIPDPTYQHLELNHIHFTENSIHLSKLMLDVVAWRRLGRHAITCSLFSGFSWAGKWGNLPTVDPSKVSITLGSEKYRT